MAMAQQQLGQTNDARATLAKGVDLADARFAKAGSLDEQWNDWIIAHALMREAKALIDSPSTSQQIK